MYQQNPDIDYGATAWENQIFYKNNFSGSLFGIRITPKIVLRENKYQGYITNYQNINLGAIVLEAPYHLVEINASPKDTLIKIPFTLVNAGTKAMNWTATSNASWLKLLTEAGSIKQEKENIIWFIVNPQGLASGNYKGSFKVTGSGQVKTYSVIFNNKTKESNKKK
jgi:hypothetical protein